MAHCKVLLKDQYYKKDNIILSMICDEKAASLEF